MGEFTPRFEQRESDARLFGPQRLPTLGAVPVRNEKGQVVMQKVKVQRYIAGKVPTYAEGHSSDSEDEAEREERRRERREAREERHREREDRDRRRDRSPRRRDGREREIAEPEILLPDKEDEEQDKEEMEERRERARQRRMEHEMQEEGDEEQDDAGSDEEEYERRRRLLRERALRREREEKMIKQELKQEAEEDEEDESDDDEESTEGESEEEEDMQMRLKPVFVRKKDRVTLVDKQMEEKREIEQKKEEDKKKEERKRESARLVEQVLREEAEMEKRRKEDNVDLKSVPTDDESEEIAYEAWKLREMKRLKRNRDERETIAKEKAELEKIHNMTEDERKAYLRSNPKIITNKAHKGKYKFLQKYFHRGVFYLDEEEDVKKRDFAEATMEDQFDKTVLPKVMQVKNFGKASRTKWSHLTQEDTTDHQGVWNTPNAMNVAFFNKKAGGTKAVFDRPANKKRKES